MNVRQKEKPPRLLRKGKALTGLFTMLFFSLAGTLSAQTEKFIVVHFSSSQKLYFPVTDIPKMILEGGNLWIGNSAFSIGNLKKYTIEEYITGIENAEDNASGNKIVVSKGNLLLSGNSSLPIRLHDTAGKEIRILRKTTGTGHVLIDTRNLVPGIYLLTVEEETLKIRIQ